MNDKLQRRIPYPGLRAYSSEEADLFFGREGCVDEMIDKLAQTGFLAVLGSSGSGKSSLVRTGLIEALQLGYHHTAGPFWTFADTHPGNAPLRNLAEGLIAISSVAHEDFGDTIQIDAMEAHLRRGPRSVIEWLDEGHIGPKQNLLLLVDQFEEVFRYGNYASREEAEAFSALLIESARHNRIHVVITMRSEYLGACALIPGLAETINRSMYLTRRMTRNECEEAIVGPSKVLGFDIEPRLVTQMLNDLASFAPWDADREVSQIQRLSRQADLLPLMQHALNRLWFLACQKSSDEVPPILRLDDYVALGRLGGALDQHGTEVLGVLGDDGAQLAESVFRGLVSGTIVANAVRLPTRFDELVKLTGAQEAQVRNVVEAFRAHGCNFLRPAPPTPVHAETVIDISHESLIRQWSALAAWMEQEVEDGGRWRQLSAEAKAHRANKADLLSDTNLAVASAWLLVVLPNAAWAERHGGDFVDTMAFVEESRAASDARRAEDLRQRRGVAWLRGGVVALLVLLAVGGWLTTQYQRGLNDQLSKTITQLADANNTLETREREQARLNTELESKNSALDVQRRAAETQARNLIDLNRSLQDFKQRSVDVVSQFGHAMDDIQDAAVLGFTEHERNLSEIIRPFQAYTLANAGELLSPENVILVKFTYANTLDRLGEQQAGIREMTEAYALAKAEIERAEHPIDLGVPFIATFFKIVTYHSWNLMNAGDYDGTAGVMNLVAVVEADLAPDTSDAQLLDGLASMFNVRGRWYDDQDREEEAYENQVRAQEYLARAIAADPDNSYYARKYGIHLGNLALQSRNLADAIKIDDPDRAEKLRTDAAEMDNERCDVFAGIYKRSRLAVTNNLENWAQCIETWSYRQRLAGEFDTARSTTDEALNLVEMLLALDPNRQQLKLAKLRMLDAAYDVESNRANGLHPGTIETGEALLAYWLQVVSKKAQLPTDVWVLDNAFSTISTYLENDGIDLDRRIANYTAAREAIAASLRTFPNARRYRQLDAKAAFKLAETIRKVDQSDPRLLTLLQTLAAHHEALGTFDKYAVPDEIFAEACDGYSGQVRLFKELKQADKMLVALNGFIKKCEPIVKAHLWDFYLWQKMSGSRFHAGELLFELGRYEEARPHLEIASYWANKTATRYLAQMSRLGLAGPKDEAKAEELEALAKRQSMKRFTIPTDFAGVKHPFHVYVLDWPEDFPYPGIDGQARWVEEYRGGKVPLDVIESFRKLHRIARENNVSFPELAVYALGTAQDDAKPSSLPESILAAKGDDFALNPAISTDSGGVAIFGYDPVSIANGRPEKGTAEFFVIHDGAIWLFANSENQTAFSADPGHFVPEFGGFCATCLAHDSKSHGNPALSLRYKDRSYLFFSQRYVDEFQADPDGVLERAKTIWEKRRTQASDYTEQVFSAFPQRSEQLAGVEEADRLIDGEKLTEARERLEDLISLGAADDPEVKPKIVEKLGSLSWNALTKGQDEIALDAANRALALDKEEAWIAGSKAHALMFLGHDVEAKEIYMRNRGIMILTRSRLWDEVVLEDFGIFRDLGRTSALMDEITKIFSGK